MADLESISLWCWCIMFLIDGTSFSFKLGLAELQTLKSLPRLALDKNVDKLQVHGDSKLVIALVNNTFRLQNHTLTPLLDMVLSPTAQLSYIYLSLSITSF